MGGGWAEGHRHGAKVVRTTNEWLGDSLSLVSSEPPGDRIQQFSYGHIRSPDAEPPLGHRSCPQAIAKIPNDPTVSGSHKPELQVRTQTTWAPGSKTGSGTSIGWGGHGKVTSFHGGLFICLFHLENGRQGEEKEWTEIAASSAAMPRYPSYNSRRGWRGQASKPRRLLRRLKVTKQLYPLCITMIENLLDGGSVRSLAVTKHPTRSPEDYLCSQTVQVTVAIYTLSSQTPACVALDACASADTRTSWVYTYIRRSERFFRRARLSVPRFSCYISSRFARLPAGISDLSSILCSEKFLLVVFSPHPF